MQPCAKDPKVECQNSGKIRMDVKVVAAVIATVATLWAMFGSLTLLEPRMHAVETHNKAQDDRIEKLASEIRQQSEILIRIDERVGQIWVSRNRP